MNTLLIVSTIFAWVVFLTPPTIIRFILIRKPIRSKIISLAISCLFFLLNVVLFSALGSDGKPNMANALGMLACYGILRYETKAQAKYRILEERKKLGYD